MLAQGLHAIAGLSPVTPWRRSALGADTHPRRQLSRCHMFEPIGDLPERFILSCWRHVGL
jgi:hypothetical protein